jgi:hypothetical protein
MKVLIKKGLIGLANAGILNGGDWFSGHFGAEVLSLALLLLNKRIEKNVEALILKRINEVFLTHVAFFETPLPREYNEKVYTLKTFEDRVERSISNFCVDGHNTIYSALALSVLARYPDLASSEIISGLFCLLDACEKAGFDRYSKVDSNAFVNDEIIKKYSFSSPLDAVKQALMLHEKVITDREIEGEFYFLSGSRLHLVTHAQALLQFQQIGYAHLAKTGLPSFTKHCIYIEESTEPQGAKAYKVKSRFDPSQASFWQREKKNPHHGKLAYSVLESFSLLPQINSQKVLNDLSAYWDFYE